MTYVYPDFICTDGIRPAPAAEGAFYAEDDVAFTTPLQVFNLADELVGTKKRADAYGYVRNVRLPVLSAVWKSGPLPEQPMQSFEGLRLELAAARVAAEGSASDAATSAAAATDAAALVGAPADAAIEAAIKGEGTLTSAALSATIASDSSVHTGVPNYSAGFYSRNNAAGDSLQIIAKPSGDTKAGLFDWRHDSGTGYLFHLTMGPNTTTNSFAIAIGMDDGGGSGILLANKKTSRGLVLNQQSSITAGTAYGVQGLQYSTLAPIMSLEQKVAGAAPTAVFRSNNTATGAQKLIEFTGEPGGVYTSWGHVSAVDGSITWAPQINANGGIYAVGSAAGTIAFQTKLAADGTDIGNYRLRITANGAITWSAANGATGPSISHSGGNLISTMRFRSNDGFMWNVAGSVQTTVGAAGTAAALPAAPYKYLKVYDETGKLLVIPAYNP